MNTNKQVRGYLNTIAMKEYGLPYSKISDKKAGNVRNIGVRLLR